MKKFLLSFSVVFAFLAYSVHQRTEGSEVKVVTPQSTGDTPQDTPIPTDSNSRQSQNNTQMPHSPMPHMGGMFKDGTYIGDVTDAFYGNVQVQTTISGGRIIDVVFLQYPNDRNTSIEINSQAMPYLKQEAIQAQSSKVDIVSGATETSLAFRTSLGSALQRAK